MTKTVVVYPGTFDPITLGHLNVIQRAASIFPKLIVAVAGDTGKKTLFDLEARTEMVKEEILNLHKTNIEVIPFHGLLMHFVASLNVKIIVRGVRDSSDFEHEFQMAYMNYKLNADVETILLPSTNNTHFISSSFVREVAVFGADVRAFVSETVSKKLVLKYAHKQNK